MAFHDNANLPLLGGQAGAGAPEDLLRTLLNRLIQEGLEREFEQFMGAGRFERSEERRGWRNGSKPRRFHTRVGTLELRIPKDRAGRFQPSLFERYERSEKAFVASLVEMYVQGVSTRKVSRVVERLCGHLVSASAVSSLVKVLDEEIAAWRGRPLAEKRYPYLVVDAHYEKVRREGRVLSTAVLWVIGIDEEGYREHLGLWSGVAESRESWGRVFEDLVRRGLSGVEYVVSDEHAGLVQSVHRYFPGAVRQRCTVHYLRNALSYVSTAKWQAAVRDGLRDVWAAPGPAEARARLHRLVDTLRGPLPKLAEYLEETAAETLGFYLLTEPDHRRKLKTTNGIEHEHAEVRRRSRVVRIFPNEGSLMRLMGALAIGRNEQWMERRYLSFRGGHVTEDGTQGLEEAA
jgi:putative transposase